MAGSPRLLRLVGALLLALLGGGAGAALAAQGEPDSPRWRVGGPEWKLDEHVLRPAAEARARRERFQATLRVRRVPVRSPAFVLEGTLWADRGNPDPRDGRPPRLAWELSDTYRLFERQWFYADRRLDIYEERQRFEEIGPLDDPSTWNEGMFVFLGLDPRLKEHFDFQIVRIAGTWMFTRGDYQRGTWQEEETFEDTHLVLTPKSTAACGRFQSVQLTADGTDWIVTHARILEVGGRELELELEGIQDLSDVRKLIMPGREDLIREGYRPWRDAR